MGCASSRLTESDAYLVFKAYDKNHDGKIDAAEVKSLLRDLGLEYTPGYVRSALRQMDEDKNGTVEWPEFEVWYRKNKPLQEARKLFKKYDKNKDGVLSLDELQMLLRDLKFQGEVSDAFQEMDRNRSGTVDMDEVVYWVSNRNRGQLKKMFDSYDTAPKDGKLNKKEVKKLLVDIGQDSREENVNEIFAKMDKDGNGVITFDEFFSWFARIQAIQDCMDLFCEYDEDDNGRIDLLELGKLLKDLSLEAEANEVMTIVDRDKDGLIALDEFINWYMGSHKIKRLREIFTQYDSNKNGSIDKGEFMYVLSDLGLPTDDKNLEKALREVDRDGSGVVEFSEFCKWYKYDV